MVKVNGPLFSLDASGTLGKAIVYSKWKGRNYVRERVIPSNPKSGPQTGRRAMFKWLTQHWAGLITSTKASWQTLADQIIAAPVNAFVKQGMEDWHNFLAPLDISDDDRSDVPSDVVLSAAVWEENRIKITRSGSSIEDQKGIVIFASLSNGFTPAVGNAILVEDDVVITAVDTFWTPPSVATWYFNSMTFALDGALLAAGGEVNAVP